MRDDSERLADIIEAIERINHQIPKDKEHFLTNELLQVWIIYHIQIIGEAASRISKEYREKTPQIAWG